MQGRTGVLHPRIVFSRAPHRERAILPSFHPLILPTPVFRRRNSLRQRCLGRNSWNFLCLFLVPCHIQSRIRVSLVLGRCQRRRVVGRQCDYVQTNLH
ncbi:hypothetical protein P280DRAFT_316693 [Massarina eburnea CBS 473.64]|uniref:Uncharacterized protein n=1 Tax=Massarina eburnea CBS 473.64 TaxID=1395130 RepID=A0A6A6S200_9PLEO|nr:hypothetical protein P280DRAFT_316693 [Massarina eburnea CBS 473.64]